MCVTPIRLRELGKALKPTQENCLPLHFSSYFLKSPDWLSAVGPVCLSRDFPQTTDLEEFEISLVPSHKDPKIFARRSVVIATSTKDAWMLDALIVVFVQALDKQTSNHRPKDQLTHAKKILQPTLHSLGQFLGKSLNFREFKTISNGGNHCRSCYFPFLKPTHSVIPY